MAKFEMYHPIYTEHYQLDWLTQSKVKDINALRRKRHPNESMIQTANDVNRQMSVIMHDQKLIWGIEDKQQRFLGIAALSPQDDSWNKAQLSLELLASNPQLASELETHFKAFSQNEFGSQSLTVSTLD